MKNPIIIKETQGPLFNILTELTAQGKTQKDLCKYLKVTDNVVMRWKKGQTESYIYSSHIKAV